MTNTELKQNIIIYNKNPAGYIKNGVATLDNMFQTEELSQWLNIQGFDTQWQDGVFEKLAVNRKYYELEDIEPLKNVRIWQLRSDFDPSSRFKPFDEMTAKHGEPDMSDYICAYDGEMQTNDLEEIYNICNNVHPTGYNGHSLAMSDVVELYDDNGSTAYYVDRIGFKEIEFGERTQTHNMDLSFSSY